MNRWEYLTLNLETKRLSSKIKDSANEELNELGAQGWELVSVFDTNDRSGRSVDVVGIFKRPVD
ncbi:MAG: DUF4177 domain-containing protein [Acidimicrobiales bacterium]